MRTELVKDGFHSDSLAHRAFPGLPHFAQRPFVPVSMFCCAMLLETAIGKRLEENDSVEPSCKRLQEAMFMEGNIDFIK